MSLLTLRADVGIARPKLAAKFTEPRRQVGSSSHTKVSHHWAHRKWEVLLGLARGQNLYQPDGQYQLRVK